MIERNKMEVLEQQFQRIFTLPVTRTTYRELQNAILTAFDGNSERANKFLNHLVLNEVEYPEMEDFVKHYSIPLRVSKQVQDSGEVLSMISTDVSMQNCNMIFSAHIRRVDGGEFSFITDITGFLQIAEHILNRTESVGANPAGKAMITSLHSRLDEMKKTVERLCEY
jgi:hypothetical protein